MTWIIMILGLIALVMSGIIIYVVAIYNGLITVKNNIDKAWGNIDVLLKQRYDELPKLMETVKGYMQHERTVLENVTKARTAFLNAHSVGEKAQADNFLSGALKSLFAVSENYPALKANENFLNLQKRISDIENEIADRREYYNDSVNTYNIRIEVMPDLFLAKVMNLKQRQMFRAQEEERWDVQIRFAQA